MFPRSSSAATRTWRGASPTRRATGATSSCSKSIRRTRTGIARPTAGATFDRYDETIEVAGEAAAAAVGPLDDLGAGDATRSQGTPARVPLGRARRRSSQQPRLPRSNRRSTIEEAFDAVNGLGTPGQNFVVADDKGRIGWTIYGSIARRVGFDGRVPVSWADGTRGWSGWLDRDEYPARRGSGERPHLDGQRARRRRRHARQDRGRQLRGRLARARSSANGSRVRTLHAADLLSIQLDTSAEFLTRWRTLLLEDAEDE